MSDESKKSDKPNNVSDLNHARPFAFAVTKYRRAGWPGTLPLPAGKKNPPPTGYTGHKAPYPTKEELLKWLNDPKHKRANIAIRLAGCAPDGKGGEDYELVGIDVDHYVKAGKVKKGGDQLAELEAKLGALPPTWISSARTDGISGIRYFRVSRGLAWRGQVAKDIECIYKGYRFAVVWPSTNPDTGGTQYWWFPPGVVPDGAGREVWNGTDMDVPRVADLPVLPDKWVEYLTQGKMRSEDDADLDMDSSVDEIYQWADLTFNYAGKMPNELSEDEAARIDSGDPTPWGMCSRMRKSLAADSAEIVAEATHHDKILKAHWHMYRLAAEGHVGWKVAVGLIEEVWANDVIAHEKRDAHEIKGEIFRSRVQALRKIKAQIDRNIALGSIAVPSQCTCVPVGVPDRAEPVIPDWAYVDDHEADFSPVESPVGASIDGQMIGNVADDTDSESDDTDSESDDAPTLRLVGDGEDAAGVEAGPFAWIADMEAEKDAARVPGSAMFEGTGAGSGLEYVQFGNPDAPDEYRMNDDGNAKHFVDLFTSPGIGPGIRFVDGLGWLVWSSGSRDGSVQPRWVSSEDGLIRRAWHLVRNRQEQFVAHLEEDVHAQISEFTAQNPNVGASAFPAALKAVQSKVKQWREFARASGNNRNALAALDAAKSLPGVTVDINDLDNAPRLLGVANGVIELTNDDTETGAAVLRPAQAQDLITLNTNVPWLHETEISKYGRERWESYLEKFLPDEEIRKTCQVALGHCLVGGNPEKIFIILKGESNTGKSTMVNLCAAAMGDYAMTAGLSIYQNHKLNPVLAKALTRRMVVTTELSESDKISASMIKRITGGSDVIQAELKGSNVTVERVPQFVPVIATNSVPSIDGADKALRNRLYVIPFNVVVDEREDDKDAAQVLKGVGLPAVLNWLIEGYMIYRRENGLPKNLVIQKESDSFASELDTVSTFLSQCVRKHSSLFGKAGHNWQDHPGWIILPSSMYSKYITWCQAMNVREPDRLSQIKFSRRVSDMGFTKKQLRTSEKNAEYWVGVKMVGKFASPVTRISDFKVQTED